MAYLIKKYLKEKRDQISVILVLKEKLKIMNVFIWGLRNKISW